MFDENDDEILPVTLSEVTIFSEKSYEFDRLLGEGSYAKVWLVKYNMETERGKKWTNLACKIIDSKLAQRDFINRFLPREMDILGKISHPHLIHLHSIYQRKTKFFLFMRFAEKGDLLDHILNNGEVKERQARLWTRQLALGLQYLHNLDIVHRDIKCENVLITANNNVKLGDFGFSRFMVDSSGKRLLSSTYCGSLAYAAPELLKGKPYNPKNCDVWSLGIVLYVMLNQCMPFSDNDMNKLFEMQVNNRWDFRRKIRAILSDDVIALVGSMLVPDAFRRIIIDDVVNHRWFSQDERLRVMSQKEREALEIGLSTKTEIIPKTTKPSIPSWKKRKKDEQLVCITSMRVERSSNQFQFQQSDVPKRFSLQNKDHLHIRTDDRHRNEERKDEVRQFEVKQEERSRANEQPRYSRESRTNLAYSLRPKATTSSVDLLETGPDGLPGSAGPSCPPRPRTSGQSKDQLVKMSLTSSTVIAPKPVLTNPKLVSNEDTTDPEKKDSLRSISSSDDDESKTRLETKK